MTKLAYNSTVAARTRTAEQILGCADLVAGYEELGGLRLDLEEIRDAGLAAEAANLGQSQARSVGKGATLDVLARFASAQKEYSAVMAVLQAARADLVRQGAPEALIAKVDDIIRNEAQVTVRTVEVEGGTKRKVAKSLSQEALRAEMAKDAGALLDLAELHPVLAARKVTAGRLAALRAAAEELSGLLGARAVAKGEARAATQVEQDAVARQRRAWGSSYRLLHALGARDERVRSLLAQARG